MNFQLILVNLVHRAHDGNLSSIPQLGLLYISTYAEKFSIKSSILHTDPPFSELSDLIDMDKEFLIGFYCNSDNINSVLKTSQMLKHKFEGKKIKILLGGPIATLNYESLSRNQNIDFICRGDGEKLTVELIHELNNGKSDYFHIDGLSYRSLEYEVIHNKTRLMELDLDIYPIPDRTKYPTKSRIEKMSLATSRGCGFRCTFCFESTQRTVRYHSVDRVIEEIKTLLQLFHLKYISFSDDVFTTNHHRLIEICNKIKENFVPFDDLFWYCEARVDALTTRPFLIDLMKSAGLARIQIGTESGSQKVIDAYKKKITIEQIIMTVQKLNEAEVQSIFTNFILGGPFDSNETFKDTLSLMIKLHELAPGRFESSCNFLTPYPGTDIYNNPSDYGLKLIDIHFESELSGCYVCAETEDFSKEDLLENFRLFNEIQNNQMFIHVKNIPLDLIREHLVNSLHGLKTQWASFLIMDEIFANWLRLVGTWKYIFKIHDSDDISTYEELVPHRTIPLYKIQNSSYVWPMLGTEITFNHLELFLVGLFSGKLNFREIIDMVYDKYKDSGIKKEELFHDVIKYSRELANLNLLVYKNKV